MSVWDKYEDRANAYGVSRREVAFNNELHLIRSKSGDNLSYFTVEIDDVTQNVVIINSDNYNEKTIISLPGEDLRHGGLVKWENNFWLITERDPNTAVYTRAKMIQCNYLLKWVSDDSIIHEQWCVIEDGTKYLTGEYEDRNFVVTRGDTRIAMTIARNEYTLKFNRECRFLIDDPDGETKIAYLLTKPFKLGGVYNGQGVYKFVLQEVNSTEDDNQELGIADYFKYFPREICVDPSKGIRIDPETNNSSDTGKKVWL